MEEYNICFHANNIEFLTDDELENLDTIFPTYAHGRQYSYLYNDIEEKILTRSNNPYNLFDVFEKKLWAAKLHSSYGKNIEGWKMYVVLNKSIAKKYLKNFGVKFDILKIDDNCNEVWSMQKIEAWDIAYAQLCDTIHTQET